MILTKQMPQTYKKLKCTAMICNLGKILGSVAITSLARNIATGNASLESHVLTISSTEAL